MIYAKKGIDAEESILTKSLPNLGTWALPNSFFIFNTRVIEVSLPKWSLGSPPSDGIDGIDWRIVCLTIKEIMI